MTNSFEIKELTIFPDTSFEKLSIFYGKNHVFFRISITVIIIKIVIVPLILDED